MATMNIIQALNTALLEEFQRNEKLVCFGEDVGHFGGVFRVTSGLQKAVGEQRCFNTPLCEQGIAGFAIGLAQRGWKPVPEIQFADYIFPAYDQIVNEMAKMRYRTGGEYSSAVVIRTPYGGGIHGGHYHSQSPEAQFLHTPGLMVVVPSDPYEAKGLLLSSLRANDPIIFMEPKRIYRACKGEVPEEDYSIPLGKAHIAQGGQHVTLIGYGAQHHQNMEAAKAVRASHGIEVEVINLRTLNPLDTTCIAQSVAKTGRCVVAHEAPLTMGFGAELVAQVMEHCFLHLEAPVRRVCGMDIPFPHTLEHAYMPDADRVVHALIETATY